MIQTRDALRFNIYSPATIDGVRYPDFTDRNIWPKVGISEIAPPAPPAEYKTNPGLYVVTEQDSAPYVVYTRLTDAEIAHQLAALVDQRWEDIKALRDRKAQSGGFPAAGKWFHSDVFSRSQQLGLARKADRVQADGGSMSTPFPGPGPGGVLAWKTMDNTFVVMTPALAHQIFDAAERQDLAMFAHAEVLRAQVNAASDPATVDINAGWPATYGGV